MQPIIKTNRLVLNILKMDDAKAVFESLNYKNTAEIISFLSWPMTMVQAEAWCQKSEIGLKNKTDFIYLARDSNNDVTGCIGLHLNKDDNKVAETGYWVDERHQGKGIASEMLSAIKEIAFHDLNLSSVFATTDIDNAASGKVLHKAGFIEDGTIDVNLGDNKIRHSKKFILHHTA